MLISFACIPADFPWIGDAFASGLQHLLGQFVFIFEEAIPTEDIAPGERKRAVLILCGVMAGKVLLPDHGSGK